MKFNLTTIVFFLSAFFNLFDLSGQNILNVFNSNGSVVSFPVAQIDSINFDIANPNLIQDADGNIYHSVQIGSQTWLKENLKTTRFFPAEEIPNISQFDEFITYAGVAYCSYYNQMIYSQTYGNLYNYFVANSIGNVCPIGYHVPTEPEWQTLIDYLGVEAIAGGKLKSLNLWDSPNVGATDEVGFSALPSGLLDPDAGFDLEGAYAWFWVSGGGPFDAKYVYLRSSTAAISQIYSTNEPTRGKSIRCIKN
jgi:uncharacterized protein (TIGR02145 family)